MSVTIPAALKRDRLITAAMRAFRNRILPVLAFSRRFESTPLEGTNIVQVPYYPLASGASSDFVDGTGYTAVQAQSPQTKPVTVNKRKYRMMDFSSKDVARQPFLDRQQVIALEAEKLADDVLADIFSIVTATNYPGTTLAAAAASAFDLDDALALRRLCNEANWPSAGRGLVLDSTFAEYLLRDSRVQNSQTSGSTDAATEGRLNRIAGFQPYEVPLIPANGAEKIAGFAAVPSAILFASAPIPPAEPLDRIVEYRTYTDPGTGLTLEYRRFGDATKDVANELVEFNYGYAVGEAVALKRITIP
jgi:hypothetical protein